MPAHLFNLKTPAALVDIDRLERNCARMSERATRLGVRLRPHVKTHKCLEAARLQVRGHFGGITVSTLAEAHAFAAGGFGDITYAYTIAPSRVAEAVHLACRIDRLSLVVDDADVLAAIESAAATPGLCLGVFLKVDCGAHRSGVAPGSTEAVALARAIARSRHVELCGLLTHAGQAYRSRNAAEARAAACTERDVLCSVAQRLRAEGIEVPELSLGSTPTLCAADDLSGLTEARPGNYVFFDAYQMAIGSCALEDVAFSVLATVVGRYPERRTLVLDAGALALSKDAGPIHVDPVCGYGIVLSADGTSRHASLRIVGLTQEHAEVRAAGDTDWSAFPVGARLRIVPNHSCLAAAQFDRYHVLRGDEVIAEWRPVKGW
jgi:D-serine deaminase-like pyridoxal phosphate-dependent protein